MWKHQDPNPTAENTKAMVRIQVYTKKHFWCINLNMQNYWKKNIKPLAFHLRNTNPFSMAAHFLFVEVFWGEEEVSLSPTSVISLEIRSGGNPEWME